MHHQEIINFGYVPFIAEWRMYKNPERTISFHQLCFGELMLVLYYRDPNVKNGLPAFKVEGLAFNIKRDLGYHETEEEARKICTNVACFVVNKIKGGKKILTFTE